MATQPRVDVPADVLGWLRWLCTALPDAYEERAWHGVRWRVRSSTFAHSLHVADGPPAFVRALGHCVPADVLSFRAPDEEVEVFRHAGPPFFYGGWGRHQLLVVLDDDTDWDEIAALVVESYCTVAPKRLATQAMSMAPRRP